MSRLQIGGLVTEGNVSISSENSLKKGGIPWSQESDRTFKANNTENADFKGDELTVEDLKLDTMKGSDKEDETVEFGKTVSEITMKELGKNLGANVAPHRGTEYDESGNFDYFHDDDEITPDVRRTSHSLIGFEHRKSSLEEVLDGLQDENNEAEDGALAC
mmetsp:Transcript_21886/g.37558  ORF Transcript_21886/g.37558 Transcript_21886/m.37558 type:complete len:161 (-) Transcript_21886:337-819(-)